MHTFSPSEIYHFVSCSLLLVSFLWFWNFEGVKDIFEFQRCRKSYFCLVFLVIFIYRFACFVAELCSLLDLLNLCSKKAKKNFFLIWLKNCSYLSLFFLWSSAKNLHLLQAYAKLFSYKNTIISWAFKSIMQSCSLLFIVPLSDINWKAHIFCSQINKGLIADGRRTLNLPRNVC